MREKYVVWSFTFKTSWKWGAHAIVTMHFVFVCFDLKQSEVGESGHSCGSNSVKWFIMLKEIYAQLEILPFWFYLLGLVGPVFLLTSIESIVLVVGLYSAPSFNRWVAVSLCILSAVTVAINSFEHSLHNSLPLLLQTGCSQFLNALSFPQATRHFCL